MSVSGRLSAAAGPPIANPVVLCWRVGGSRWRAGRFGGAREVVLSVPLAFCWVLEKHEAGVAGWSSQA